MLSEERLQEWGQDYEHANAWAPGTVVRALIAEVRRLQEENKALLLRAEDRRRLTDEIARLRRTLEDIAQLSPCGHADAQRAYDWAKAGLEPQLSENAQEEE